MAFDLRTPMDRMQKDDILERLVAAEGFCVGHSRSEDTRAPQSCDHWSNPVLLERAAYLRKLARFGEGNASEVVKEYPGYRTLLSVHLRSSDAEVNEEFAELLIVLDGRATLITGGELQKAYRIGPGEHRGANISGGTMQELRTGDVIHISAGTPHQLQLACEKTFSCLIVQIAQAMHP